MAMVAASVLTWLRAVLALIPKTRPISFFLGYELEYLKLSRGQV